MAMFGASYFGPGYFGNYFGVGPSNASPTTGTTTVGDAFFNIKIAELIIDAYQRIQIDETGLNAMHMASARRSINLLYSLWSSKNLNLWTVEQDFLDLTTNQFNYSLPVDTVDVIQCTLRTFTRPTGTYYSLLGGTVANAFDGNLQTTCTQTVADGSIAVDYGSNNDQLISMCGIYSYTEQEYDLSFEYSSDGVTWAEVADIGPFEYPALTGQWFVINAPVQAQWFRMREKGGATLNIAESYFVTQPVDTALGRISRSNQFNVSQKFAPGRPSAYMVNRLREPTLTLYPPPISQYMLLVYARIRNMASVDASAETLTIPQRFYEPMVAGLAAKLARKFRPEQAQELAAEAEIAFNIAAAEDRDRAPLSILPDMSGMM